MSVLDENITHNFVSWHSCTSQLRPRPPPQDIAREYRGLGRGITLLYLRVYPGGRGQ